MSDEGIVEFNFILETEFDEKLLPKVTRLEHNSKTVYYPCEALIDQGRYIGEDSMGRACCKPVEIRIEDHLICVDCAKLLLDAPEKVTLVEYSDTPEERIEKWKDMASKCLRVK